MLPLPQRFDAGQAIDCAPGSIEISTQIDDPTVDEAVRQLRDAAGPCDESVQLRIELQLDDGADDELAGLPNARQAYRIAPQGEAEFRITATTSVGLLYGALTMAQLLRAGRQHDRITVPRAAVLDWPDIEERGLWNFPDAANWIEWLSRIKLNYGKMADTQHPAVVRGEPGSSIIDVGLLQRGRVLGFNYVPYVVHLNFLHGIGLYQAWPELAGIGDSALAGRYFAHKQGDQHRAPCASQPVLVDLLTDWIVSMADQGADEVSCWLSERPCQCECQRCTPVGQFLLETRAFLSAWKRACAKHPDLTIRIFSSTTTPEQDAEILAELPPTVRFERACATTMDRVQHLPRDLFRNPLIDEAARDGRWVASYDVPLGAYGQVDTPEFKVPQFSAQRIRDFVVQLHERSYAGAYGMLAWGTMAREVCGFAIHALAEYSWNGNGRSVRDFAVAWATREGWSDPDAVGAWAECLGEIEFDVYDGDFPMGWSWGHAADLVEQRLAPRFGQGLFRHFPDESAFDRAAVSCDRALGFVESLDPPVLALATAVVRSYVEALRCLWHVSHLHAHADLTDVDVQAELRERVDALVQAGQQNMDAIAAWRSHLGPEPWQHRVHDAIAAMGDTVQRIRSHIHDRILY